MSDVRVSEDEKKRTIALLAVITETIELNAPNDKSHVIISALSSALVNYFMANNASPENFRDNMLYLARLYKRECGK